ncbi:MAG: thioesterase [Thermoflexibacter sp.]
MIGIEKFRIRANEVDFRHRLTVPALVNFLQETAMHNIGEIGLPMNILHEKNLGWVLSRLHLLVSRYPKSMEEIKVQTCAHAFEKYQAYRDFRIYDGQNELIATAASSWLVFDLEKRQLIAIPDFVKDSVSICKKETPLFMPKAKLPPLQNIDYQFYHQVCWHDLDTNNHVNNTFYFQWALESLPIKILNHFFVEEWDMIFKNECFFGEKIIAQAQLSEKLTREQGEEKLTFLLRIIKEVDNKEVIQAKVKLKSIESFIN